MKVCVEFLVKTGKGLQCSVPPSVCMKLLCAHSLRTQIALNQSQAALLSFGGHTVCPSHSVLPLQHNSCHRQHRNQPVLLVRVMEVPVPLTLPS